MGGGSNLGLSTCFAPLCSGASTFRYQRRTTIVARVCKRGDATGDIAVSWPLNSAATTQGYRSGVAPATSAKLVVLYICSMFCRFQRVSTSLYGWERRKSGRRGLL